jgi:PKD repeat protein
MLKRLLPAIAFLCLSQISFSQCAIQTWSLQKRVDLSNLVVEGKVMDQYCFRETRNNAIYTASIIEVYKVFKGSFVNPYYIEVLTYGGQIGFERHRADPELELEKGDMGVFLLNNHNVDLPNAVLNNGKLKFRGVANYHSFINYDLDENKAYDVSQTFKGIQTELYETIQSLTKQSINPLRSSGYNPERLKYRPIGPVITGFGNASANAGTGDEIIIIGQGFGNAKGNGRIEFIDANFGDGRKFKTPFTKDYSIWTDTLIKVRIPSRAGSGGIKIVANDSGSFSTFNSFKINFSHLNVEYQPTGGSKQYYTTDHINDNNKGGYTFQFNTRFKSNSGMVNCFLRSMETWRCGTFMNWELGRDTTVKVTAADKVNLVRLTDFTDNTLAVCYSYWSGCFTSGTNMEWFVNELDIEVDSTIKWNLTTNKPGSGEYDLQSVLSHELGHGHQLGHVIASAEMMHFSIGSGQKKASLSSNDLSGGNYVRAKSTNINVCSGARLVALTSNNCNYTKPLAGFKVDKISGCPNSSIIFTDTTQGVVKSYSWDFGANANPAVVSGKGPHTVTYSGAGNKTIRLYVSNDFGTDSAVKTNYLDILPAKPPVPQNLTYLDTACLALATLSVDTVPGIATLTWQLPATASLISSTQYTKRISWTAAGGPYRFWVKSVNACGSSDSVTGDVVVLKNPTSSFTAVENGRVVTFTNASQFATNYNWLFGDGDSSTLINPVHTYPMGKTYNATLKSSNRCKTISFSMNVNPVHPSGIINSNVQNQLVFPNPTTGIVNFSQDVKTYTLFNAMGQELMKGNNIRIDLSNQPSGLYILNLISRDNTTSFIKLIKN